MRVKFGSIITDGRGKLGGHIVQKGITSKVMRTRQKKVNRVSAKQLRYRSRLHQLQKMYQELEESQVNMWKLVADANPITNTFGDQITLNAYNFFVKCNLNLLLVGRPPRETPQFEEGVPIISNLEVRYNENDNIFRVNYGLESGSGRLAVYATRGLPNNRKPKEKDFRYLFFLNTSASTPQEMNEEIYKDVFGSVYMTGNIYFKVRGISVNGLESMKHVVKVKDLE